MNSRGEIDQYLQHLKEFHLQSVVKFKIQIFSLGSIHIY